MWQGMRWRWRSRPACRRRAIDSVAWGALVALSWGTGLIDRAPLIAWLSWTRRDSLALTLTLVMVPALVGTAFVKAGTTDGGGAHHRAYFTTVVLWHSALTTETYTADRELHYYWTCFMVAPAIASRAPDVFGDAPLPWLLINGPAPACS